MKVVVDTNVLVSGIFWGGVPGKILDHWIEDSFELIVSDEIFTEYKRVIELLAKKAKGVNAESLINMIAIKSSFVKPNATIFPACDDPDDDKFLEAAVYGKAKYLVSGDKLLLKVAKYKSGLVILPRDFLALL